MTIKDTFNYILKNPMGNKQMGTWNVLPSVLSVWSNLLANQGNKTSYSLYKQQALDFIDNAKENAELIKKKGEIDLRNLRIKHNLEKGDDLAKLGARGGNLSGSNLDVLVQKEKIRKMDEQTLTANTAIQANQEIINGYRQAYTAYGNLRAYSVSNKWSAIASIVKGIETYVGLQARDKMTISNLEAKRDTLNKYKEATWDYKENLYGQKPEVVNRTLEGDTINGNYDFGVSSGLAIINPSDQKELDKITFV